jgi:hypothetical protein
MHMENLMEVGRGSSAREEEVVEDNFTKIQKLIIKVKALGSTITFALEMMARLQVLIGQLQDEVDYRRKHGESLQWKLDQRGARSESLA